MQEQIRMEAFTAQIGKYTGPDGLDITIKSARGLGRTFAPTDWKMVLGVKRGTVSRAAYEQWYLELMRKSYRERRRDWEQLLARARVVLLCYCPPGTPYCHRYLLANILGKLGATIRGELRSAPVVSARGTGKTRPQKPKGEQ